MSKLHIAAIRSEYDWTQEEAAKKIGITKGYYSNIENGRKKPSYDLILKLQSTFGYNIEHLLSEKVN